MIFNYRQKLLAKHTRNCDTLLDIGFAEIPNKYLSNKKVIGLDLQKVEKPINYTQVITGNANELNLLFGGCSFDGICSGELFEHLMDPLTFLKKCHEVLKPNGIIALSTPNPHNLFEFASTICLSKKVFYDPEHVCIYPQRWLIRMFEIAGFTNVKIRSGGFGIPIFGDIWFPRPIAEFSLVTAKATK